MTDLGWRLATVVDIRTETSDAKSYRLALPEPVDHLAGQHVVVRLTAPDGYTAQRSYSIASAADGSNELELTVERLEGGEVSSYLHDVAEPGDVLEVRGPIGRWFVWDGTVPALLVGGGSGVVPLMAMLRLARQIGQEDLLRVLVSARSPDDLYYRDEIAGPVTHLVFSRSIPAGFRRGPGRVILDDLAPLVRDNDMAYVCGSHGFAEAVTGLLAQAALPPERIRVERFGPSG